MRNPFISPEQSRHNQEAKKWAAHVDEFSAARAALGRITYEIRLDNARSAEQSAAAAEEAAIARAHDHLVDDGGEITSPAERQVYDYQVELDGSESTEV